MARATYHHGDLRPALIAAARRQLEHAGPGGTTLRAVARGAGVSPAAPYHHFADREDLLAALAAEGFAELAAAMAGGARRGAATEALSRLRAAGVAYVRFAVRNPEVFRLMFSGMLEDRSRYPELERSASEAFAVLERLLGAEPSGAREARPHPAALAAWSTVHGLAVLLIEGRLGERPSERQATRIAQDVVQVLGAGLKSVVK